jgi:DNA replication licensing factor MCM7
MEFDGGDRQLVENIENNTRRYIDMFSRAVDSLMPNPTRDDIERDVWDVLREQRLQAVTVEPGEDPLAKFPTELMRRYTLRIKPRQQHQMQPMRETLAKDVGKLVRLKGIVTRVTDVRPMIKVATYTCDVCGNENYQVIDDSEYTPLGTCQSRQCVQNNNKGQLYAQTRGSKFVKFQDMKLQEVPSEVPVGNIPRSIRVLVSGDLTRKCKPGDIVEIAGVFLVHRHSGFRAIRAGLTTTTYIEAMDVEPQKKSYTDFTFTDELKERIEEESSDADLYSKMARSIAPEIYGMEDIKKALLLLLCSGVTRHLPDGMKIRGDINIMMLGDPGVAKSQLLKHVAHVAPRGVYTTGKGSSGVGLTAAIVKDPISGEMTLEGGALVLADMGICCIDEFDKMEDGDRTAIHEVMEQQTVSIAKAGITTTLNARASVLAAANPVWGRYNPKKTAEQNIGLPTALLSRFDLIFLLLDRPNFDNDLQLAQHITTVHRTRAHPALEFEPYKPAFIRAYIAKARSYEPYIPRDLTENITSIYVGMRKQNDDAEDLKSNRERFCTARSLLSVLRLSQALARLRFAEVVDADDVSEAARLLKVSQHITDEEEVAARQQDFQSRIFEIIKDAAQNNRNKKAKMSEIVMKAKTQGFSELDVMNTIEEYQEIGAIKVSRDHAVVRLV